MASASCVISSSSSSSWPVASSIDEKLYLITRNLDEVMGGETALTKMRDILKTRDLKLYWGTATTGAPHVAYFVPMSKIADFLRAGCEVTILFADLHAYLDNLKSEWEQLKYRTEYYEYIIKGMLSSIGVPLDKLKFVRGTEYQLKADYTLDMYRLTTITSERNAKKAGAEVVKQSDAPPVSGLIYPLLQALDEEYLKVDIQFGGVDQRKIFTYAEENLPSIGYTKRIHLMNPMVPGLTGTKMSSSEASSKIDVLDSADQVKQKINGAVAAEKIVEGNGVLAFTRMVLFSVSPVKVYHNKHGEGYLVELNDDTNIIKARYLNGELIESPVSECRLEGGFTIERNPKYGTNTTYYTYHQLEKAYIAGDIHPGDLKSAVTKALNKLLDPIRQSFSTPDMQNIIRLAYPEKFPQENKKKKGKEEGTGKEEKKERVDTGKALSVLELRVGEIITVEEISGDDKLLSLELLFKDNKKYKSIVPLKSHYKREELLGKKIVAVVNVEEQIIAGLTSTALLLIFFSTNNNKAEIVLAPEGSIVGERIKFPGLELLANVDDDQQLKTAHYRAVGNTLSELEINDNGDIHYHNINATTTAGLLKVASLKKSDNAAIKDTHHQESAAESQKRGAKKEKK